MSESLYKAKPILISLNTDNPKGTVELLSKLMGIPFARSLTTQWEAYHAPVSSDGMLLLVFNCGCDAPPFTVYFAVAELDEAIAEIEASGGALHSEITDLPVAESAFPNFKEAYRKDHPDIPDESIVPTLGKSATLRMGDGTHIGLVQLEEYAEVFFRPREGTALFGSNYYLERFVEHSVAAGEELQESLRASGQ